jgi:hypothetical protein
MRLCVQPWSQVGAVAAKLPCGTTIYAESPQCWHAWSGQRLPCGLDSIAGLANKQTRARRQDWLSLNSVHSSTHIAYTDHTTLLRN